MHYRMATLEDTKAILELYRRVARIPGGLARKESELSENYVGDFVSKSLESGLIIVGEHPSVPGELICELHAYKKGLTVFDHVLGDLTLVVHPEHQGKKLGRTIFTIFLTEISESRPDVGKVELVTRESNTRAISLYQSLGFRIEGRMEMRIKNESGNYEADIPMGWQNPNFEF